MFLSAVAERFRDFKSKLVTGWITKRRARTTKKVKTGNEGGEQAPSKMPYEIWGHISKRDWEAFVAKRTTPIEVVSISYYIIVYQFEFTSFDSVIKLIHDIRFLLIN